MSDQEKRSLIGEDVYFFSQKEGKIVCAKVEHVEVTLGPKGEVSVAFDLLSSDGGLGKRWLVPALYVHQDEETAWKFARGVVAARPSANTWALDRILGELGAWLVTVGASPQAEAPQAEAPQAEAPQAEAPQAEDLQKTSSDMQRASFFTKTLILAGVVHKREGRDGRWPVRYVCEQPKHVDYDAIYFYNNTPWSENGISVQVRAGDRTLRVLRCDGVAQAIKLTAALVGACKNGKKV